MSKCLTVLVKPVCWTPWSRSSTACCDDFDVVELLTGLTERCVELLDIAAAGLLLADPLQQLHLLAATSKEARELELFQLQADEGPCVDCYATGEPVTIADVRAASRPVAAVRRRPRSRPASPRCTPSRCGLPAPSSVRSACSASGPVELNEADVLVGQTLAHVACVAILQEHAPTPATVMPQLRSALTSRVIVEQAKGFLRGVLDVSVEDAFSLLRVYARDRGRHLTDVAHQLMTDRASRTMLVAELSELLAAPPR